MRKLLLLVLCGNSYALFADAANIRSDLTAADQRRVTAVTQATTDFSKAEAFEAKPGGAATTSAPPNTHIYSQPQANLSFEEREQFNLGNALFRKIWVSSPATTQASDGLGPLYNARSCQSCHVKDGRGHLPSSGEVASSFLLQLKQFDEATNIWSGDSYFGEQLQTSAVPGLLAEGTIDIEFTSKIIEFDNGDKLEMRKPAYTVRTSGNRALDVNTGISARVAPGMIGMGLLEAIADSDLLALEDVNDENNDGISGKAALITSNNGTTRVGRFGWKAGQADVLTQSAAAFLNDMGLSTTLHPAHWGDCSDQQQACRRSAHGEQLRLGKGEVPEPLLELVAHYARNLAPPLRRDVDDKDVLAGKQLFYESGCTACHTPKFVTSRNALADPQKFQLIWPYSDLLLHDMGDELADGVGNNGGASGREWRTPPLWGLGLVKIVNPRASYLHDGRARTLLEAVLWHGGEALASQQRVLSMSRRQRNQLLRFMESL
jgi:CxxC motif-containing protein (DUF1111 family)